MAYCILNNICYILLVYETILLTVYNSFYFDKIAIFPYIFFILLYYSNAAKLIFISKNDIFFDNLSS